MSSVSPVPQTTVSSLTSLIISSNLARLSPVMSNVTPSLQGVALPMELDLAPQGIGMPQVIVKPQHLTYLRDFRTQQCPLFANHKCSQHKPFTCFHWHFPNQRRRRPLRKLDGTFSYSPDVYCDKYDETRGECPNGDACPYLHRNAGDTERRYHQRYFKTGTCIHDTDSRGQCSRNGTHCAFAHGATDLRVPVYDIREVQEANDCPVNLPASLEKERVLSEDPKWNDMAYVLANYKTEPCRKPPRMCRQGYACPFYHNAKDKRRQPHRFKYRWPWTMSYRRQDGRTHMDQLIHHSPEFAMRVLDYGIETTVRDPMDKNFAVIYNYSLIDPGPDDPASQPHRYLALMTMARYKQLDLLKHPLSLAVMQEKWQKFACFSLAIDILFYVMFVATLTIFVVDQGPLLPAQMDELGCRNTSAGMKRSLNSTSSPGSGSGRPKLTSWRIIAEKSIITCFLIIRILLELLKLFHKTPFSTVPYAILKAFDMTVGELEFVTYFITADYGSFQIAVQCVFVAFVVIMPIALMNLLVGIAVGDIEGITRDAELQLLAIRINLIYEVETNSPRYFQRRLHRSHMEVYPNRTYTGIKAMFRGSFEDDYRAYKTAQRAERSGEKSENESAGLGDIVQQQSDRIADLERSIKDLTTKLNSFIS